MFPLASLADGGCLLLYHSHTGSVRTPCPPWPARGIEYRDTHFDLYSQHTIRTAATDKGH